MKKSYEMDMCSGHILKKILIFSIPLMLSDVYKRQQDSFFRIYAGAPQGGQRGYGEENTGGKIDGYLKAGRAVLF